MQPALGLIGLSLCHKYIFANPFRPRNYKVIVLDLFSQAWSKGMTISSITSGFQNTAFNSQAILSKVSTQNVKNKDTTSHKTPAPEIQDDINKGMSGEQHTANGLIMTLGDTNQVETLPSLSEETIQVSEKKLENGYNLYTHSNYVAWLQAHHPKSLPSFTTVLSLFAEVDNGLQDKQLHG